MTRNEETEAQIAKETLIDAVKTLYETDEDYYEITTEDALLDYLGLDDIPRHNSHDDVTLLTSARSDTLPVKHYLFRTADHGWVHVRSTDDNPGKYRVHYRIKHIGEVEFDPRGIDVGGLLSRCETRGIGIDESHAETVDEWVQYEAEGVAEYVDDVAAVVSDGSALYLETRGRRLGKLRSELDYQFEDREWDVFRDEVSRTIRTSSPTHLTRDLHVEYVVRLDYEPPS